MFTNGSSNFARKIIKDEKGFVELIAALKKQGFKIVVTIGSWDLLHIGHVRYLIKAKEFGDVLVVGVDTDRAIKLYKGPFRPVVPQEERCEMLTYQSVVDFVILVDDVNKKGEWQYRLIKKLKPDVFVAVEDSYPKRQLAEIRKYATKTVVLPRQAEKTSTSDMVQSTLKDHLLAMVEMVSKGGGR